MKVIRKWVYNYNHTYDSEKVLNFVESESESKKKLIPKVCLPQIKHMFDLLDIG
jgi:hypothetical protein